MVLLVEIGHGYDEQSVILSGVAVDDGRARVGSRPVGAQQLSGQRLFEVGHKCLLKSEITHRLIVFSFYVSVFSVSITVVG